MADISIAPMIGWTDRHYRYLFRHITQRPTLFTEMIMDTAVLYNLDKLDDFIGHDRSFEPPLALQLGGNNPETLGKAVEAAEQYGGFSEINLNCGCPSNKAKRAGFGAELMLEPELVKKIVYEMKRRSTSTDITVKCRIGTNTRDTWGQLLEFVHACRDGGIQKMIIHARICVLCGLSPAQNRNIPPLRYDIVSRLVETFPEMKFVLNGGVRTFDEIDTLLGRRESEGSCQYGSSGCYSSSEMACAAQYDLTEKLSLPWSGTTSRGAGSAPVSVFTDIATLQQQHRDHDSTRGGEPDCQSGEAMPQSGQTSISRLTPVHGVMVGREAYNNPWAWATTDSHYYGKADPSYTRREALDRYLAYAEEVLLSGAPRSSIPYLCKPLHNFFTGSRANKHYKRKLDYLLKEHVAHSEKGHRGHVVSGADGAPSFTELVTEAVREIPDGFLDSRGPEGRGQREAGEVGRDNNDCDAGLES